MFFGGNVLPETLSSRQVDIFGLQGAERHLFFFYGLNSFRKDFAAADGLKSESVRVAIKTQAVV